MKKKLSLVFLVAVSASLIAMSGCSKIVDQLDPTEKASVSESDDENNYTIEYYPDVDSSEASSETTLAIAGQETKLLTIEELGFSKDGYGFLGWRINRETDDKWFLRDSNKKSGWYSLVNGKLPEGYTFDLRGDGGVLIKPATEGTVRLFAYWGPKYYIEYYADIDSEEPSSITTEGICGKWTTIETLENLGYDDTDDTFVGWRINRSIDDKWYLKDPNGKSDWYSLEDGELPTGYTFNYRDDGAKFWAPTSSGEVKLYAEWR